MTTETKTKLVMNSNRELEKTEIKVRGLPTQVNKVTGELILPNSVLIYVIPPQETVQQGIIIPPSAQTTPSGIVTQKGRNVENCEIGDIVALRWKPYYPNPNDSRDVRVKPVAEEIIIDNELYHLMFEHDLLWKFGNINDTIPTQETVTESVIVS